jgi:hypothetical protein
MFVKDSGLLNVMFIKDFGKDSETCLNRTLNKPESLINMTFNKPESLINMAFNKPESLINMTFNKPDFLINMTFNKPESLINMTSTLLYHIEVCGRGVVSVIIFGFITNQYCYLFTSNTNSDFCVQIGFLNVLQTLCITTRNTDMNETFTILH